MLGGRAGTHRACGPGGRASERASCAQAGATALHLAARQGHVAAVEALLAAGADPSAVDAVRRTPGGRPREGG